MSKQSVGLPKLGWVIKQKHVCVHVKLLQSCPTLWDPMDYSPPGSSVHGILQARILEWVAMPFSPGDLPNPGVKRRSFLSPALAGRFFTTSATWKAQIKASVQFSHSVMSTLDPMDCSTTGFLSLTNSQSLLKLMSIASCDAIQPSHPLSSPFPPSFNLSQHLGLFQWVNSSHQAAKVLEFQLQHQSFQWIFRTDFL